MMLKKIVSKTLTVTLILVLITVTIFFVLIQKIVYLAADPTQKKDCPPLIPFSNIDPNKKTNLVLADEARELPWLQKGGVINDASCLDQTDIYGIVHVKTEEDIKQSLLYAKEKGLKNFTSWS